jgi:hypothetical protein
VAGPIKVPDTGFPFCCLLRLAGLRWRYSNPLSHGNWPVAGTLIIYKNAVRTSQETRYYSVTEPNRVGPFEETVAVYCENCTEHTNTPCWQNTAQSFGMPKQVVHIVTTEF